MYYTNIGYFFKVRNIMIHLWKKNHPIYDGLNKEKEEQMLRCKSSDRSEYFSETTKKTLLIKRFKKIKYMKGYSKK